jgi:hypothetical protein
LRDLERIMEVFHMVGDHNSGIALLALWKSNPLQIQNRKFFPCKKGSSNNMFDAHTHYTGY